MIDSCKDDEFGLFLLDELYKGTNTVERIAAAGSVLSFLARNNNIVFVATHDVELAEILKDQFDLYHFGESINGKDIIFDYKLKNGTITETNAIRILAINNYPEAIIRQAHQNLKSSLMD